MPDALQMDNELAFSGSNRYPRSFGSALSAFVLRARGVATRSFYSGKRTLAKMGLLKNLTILFIVKKGFCKHKPLKAWKTCLCMNNLLLIFITVIIVTVRKAIKHLMKPMHYYYPGLLQRNNPSANS